MPKPTSVKLVESLLKGLKVMETVGSHTHGLALPEIVRATGLPKATAYRILQTLLAAGYLHYFEDTALYHLGPKAMGLGMSALSAQELGPLSEPYLRELSAHINQNVNMGILDQDHVVYIIRIKVRRILGINLSVGSRLPAYNTAIGMALMAFGDPAGLPRVMERLAGDPQAALHIGPHGRDLMARLDKIRAQGYALVENDYIPGLHSVAVPVMGRDGCAEAAINVPVFNQLCSPQELRESHLPQVLATAQTISQLRGYRPQSQTD